MSQPLIVYFPVRQSCLILVATPPALVSLMKNPEQVIDFTKLPHFVIDEFGQMADLFDNDLAQIKFWLYNPNCQVGFKKFPFSLNFPLTTNSFFVLNKKYEGGHNYQRMEYNFNKHSKTKENC